LYNCIVASIVASLPFPPLPVLVLQGEDSEYGMASSFDLLQTAMLNTYLGFRPQGFDASAQQAGDA
jgi:hypothetical protein